jgi:hypothetical protein
MDANLGVRHTYLIVSEKRVFQPRWIELILGNLALGDLPGIAWRATRTPHEPKFFRNLRAVLGLSS